jgi:hypothetical protein
MPRGDAPEQPLRRGVLRGFLAIAPAICALACVGWPAAVRAEGIAGQGVAEPGVVELEVKAAYLYKFANFVEWPDDAFRDAAQPIVIGVLGVDDVVGELQRMVQGTSVKGRGFVLRRMQPGDDLSGLHILFVGDLDRATVATVLAAVKGKHVLTVSDSRRVFAGGSMVNLLVVKQRVPFEVALPQVQRSRLRLSALMLTAAYRIQKNAP